MARFAVSPLLGKEVAPYNENIWSNVSSHFTWGKRKDKPLEIINVSDEFLQQKGGLRALESYVYLLYDSTVQSNMIKLVQEMTSRELKVIPASEKRKDLKVAQEVERQLSHLNMDELFRKMAEAYVVGFAPAEVMWRKSHSGVIEAYDLRMRDPRRFVWTPDEAAPGGFSMRLLTRENPMEGIEVPTRKFIPFKYWVSNNGDPYGSGLGRILYFLVKVKRRALESEVLYTDRFATPTAIVTAPLSATEEEINKVYDLISNLSQETGVILPEGFSLDFANPTGTPDTFTNLRDYLVKQISFLIAGEDESGSSEAGSRASSEVAVDVRSRKAQELSELICRCLNETLVKWIVQLNFGMEVEPPTIERDFPMEEPSQLSAQDLGVLMEKLSVKPTLTWVEKHFKVELERNSSGGYAVAEQEGSNQEQLASSFFAPSPPDGEVTEEEPG